MQRLATALLLLLLGCQGGLPKETPTPSPRAVNILDYTIVRQWELGMEVLVQPAARVRATQDDLRAINQELLRQHPDRGELTILYRDSERELAQYSLNGDHWIWRSSLQRPTPQMETEL